MLDIWWDRNYLPPDVMAEVRRAVFSPVARFVPRPVAAPAAHPPEPAKPTPPATGAPPKPRMYYDVPAGVMIKHINVRCTPLCVCQACRC